MSDTLDQHRAKLHREPAKGWKVRVRLRVTSDIVGWNLRLRPGQPWVWPRTYPSREIAEQAIAEWIEANRPKHPDIDFWILEAKPFPVEAP